MSDVNQFHDQIFDDFTPKKKMPDMLNVLTILTFIASGYGVIMAFVGYIKSCKDLDKLNQASSQFGGKGFMANFMQNAADMAYRSCELKMPLLIIGLIFPIICIIGAVFMRKLQTKGFYIYLIGEVGAPVATLLIFGVNLFTGAMFFFPILFLILYATQLKHLK